MGLFGSHLTTTKKLSMVDSAEGDSRSTPGRDLGDPSLGNPSLSQLVESVRETALVCTFHSNLGFNSNRPTLTLTPGRMSAEWSIWESGALSVDSARPGLLRSEPVHEVCFLRPR
jgi:hypothetical protein